MLKQWKMGTVKLKENQRVLRRKFGGPKKYEEGETKIEESVELGTSKEVCRINGNTEDIATATHETQEKQTEEMYSQQVDKPDVCMVSETESEENVNKSPPGEVQNLILEENS
ncbi:hypothetical protein OIU78_018226 [Salix suchowensis]|nr:hypothetical protein OIU78_018226 [Salix suchowensis]